MQQISPRNIEFLMHGEYFQTRSCPPREGCRWWAGWRARLASCPPWGPRTTLRTSPSRSASAPPTSWWAPCTPGAGCWPGSRTSPSSARRTPRSRWRNTDRMSPSQHSSPRASSRSFLLTRALSASKSSNLTKKKKGTVFDVFNLLGTRFPALQINGWDSGPSYNLFACHLLPIGFNCSL